MAPLLLLGFCFSLLLSATTAADAEWRILALRVDFPHENPDELTTTGIGAFDLRSAEEAAEDYVLPYDLPPHDRAYFERHLTALARYYEVRFRRSGGDLRRGLPPRHAAGVRASPIHAPLRQWTHD